jgi:hypothetical protein
MAAANDGPAAPDAVFKAIEANYERIRSVQATIESTLLNPSVKQPTVVSGTTDNGLAYTIATAPKSTHTYRLVLRGRDVYRAELVNGMERDYFSFHRGVWTQYDGQAKMAWLRLPEQMPGLFPLDPRDYGSTEVREHFLDRLRHARVVEATKDKRADGTPFALLVMDRSNGHRWQVEFDSSKNFLPTAIDYLYGDGSLNVGIRITYRNVIKAPDAAWFPEAMTVKLFGPEGGKSFDATDANSVLTETVKGDIHVNQAVPEDLFEKNLPEGTRISDAVTSAVHIAK